MKRMATVSEVLAKLKEEGYTVDFNIQDNCLICHGNSLRINPGEFVVDRHYRFEGMSDPDDEAIIYAISSEKNNVKGTLLNGYGISSDEIASELVQALRVNPEHLGTIIGSSENNSPESPEKYNESTPSRPEGERPLDAPMVSMDLRKFMKQIKEEQAWKTGERNAITVFKTSGLSIVMIALHEGAELKTHKAAGMICLQVLEGEITFITESESTVLETGQMLTLHQGILHSVTGNKESVFLLTVANLPV